MLTSGPKALIDAAAHADAQRAAKIRLSLNPSIPYPGGLIDRAAAPPRSRPQLFCSDRSALQSLLWRPKFSG